MIANDSVALRVPQKPHRSPTALVPKKRSPITYSIEKVKQRAAGKPQFA